MSPMKALGVLSEVGAMIEGMRELAEILAKQMTPAPVPVEWRAACRAIGIFALPDVRL